MLLSDGQSEANLPVKRSQGDFYGLPMRRDVEHVVDPPLVFKRGFLVDERRALDGENLRRAPPLGRWRTEIGGERKKRR
ncbi:hypothetical protein TNCV_522891 [Trichonephila clavipes]|nr:hypothetical protein TNCV_522891 [Trichonephila clavipes]